MTAPEEDLEQALRRALSAAVGEVEPGSDGLERIFARTSQRPPKSWSKAVASALLDRVRHWTWRGHWAWPRASFSFPRDSLPRLVSLIANPRGASSPRGWRALAASANRFRPAAVLAGVAFIVSATMAVAPLRQAVVQVSSSVLTGGQPATVLGAHLNGGALIGGTSPSASPGGLGASPAATTALGSPAPGTTAPGASCSTPGPASPPATAVTATNTGGSASSAPLTNAALAGVTLTNGNGTPPALASVAQAAFIGAAQDARVLSPEAENLVARATSHCGAASTKAAGTPASTASPSAPASGPAQPTTAPVTAAPTTPAPSTTPPAAPSSPASSPAPTTPPPSPTDSSGTGTSGTGSSGTGSGATDAPPAGGGATSGPVAQPSPSPSTSTDSAAPTPVTVTVTQSTLAPSTLAPSLDVATVTPAAMITLIREFLGY